MIADTATKQWLLFQRVSSQKPCGAYWFVPYKLFLDSLAQLRPAACPYRYTYFCYAVVECEAFKKRQAKSV
jgi:hypothetical protein